MRSTEFGEKSHTVAHHQPALINVGNIRGFNPVKSLPLVKIPIHRLWREHVEPHGLLNTAFLGMNTLVAPKEALHPLASNVSLVFRHP